MMMYNNIFVTDNIHIVPYLILQLYIYNNIDAIYLKVIRYE